MNSVFIVWYWDGIEITIHTILSTREKAEKILSEIDKSATPWIQEMEVE